MKAQGLRHIKIDPFLKIDETLYKHTFLIIEDLDLH